MYKSINQEENGFGSASFAQLVCSACGWWKAQQARLNPAEKSEKINMIDLTTVHYFISDWAYQNNSSRWFAIMQL
jgi:hypothetical protein